MGTYHGYIIFADFQQLCMRMRLCSFMRYCCVLLELQQIMDEVTRDGEITILFSREAPGSTCAELK